MRAKGITQYYRLDFLFIFSSANKKKIKKNHVTALKILISCRVGSLCTLLSVKNKLSDGKNMIVETYEGTREESGEVAISSAPPHSAACLRQIHLAIDSV